MPTAAAISWTGQKLEPYIHPGTARMISIRLGANLNLAQGTVLGEVTATPGVFKAYNNANADGSEVAKAILPYAVQTDANGLITLSSTAAQGGDEQGDKLQTIDVYVSGYFLTTDLTGLDAAGIADLGRLVEGALASGILKVN